MQPLAPACQNAPEHTFTDEALLGAEGSEVEEAAECLLAYGITTGDTAGNYSPNERTSREQMGSFIARKVKRLQTPPTVTPGNKFAGEGISAVHRPNVEYIAATNPAITVGYSDGTFKALRGVARDEMATFIVRQLRVAGATVPDGSGAQQFPDVDPASPHAQNIRILRQLGIVQGDANGNYNPKQIVSRAQMALFLGRDIAYLVIQGKMVPVGGQTGQNLTALPELISARVVGTTTTGINAGTVVEYLFDEEVRVPNGALFYVVNANNARTPGGIIVSQANVNAVHVRYPGITTAAGASALTVATVDRGAVQDITGGTNPEGDAALGATGGQALPAGETAAPDLTAVQNFRPATSTQTFVDFLFDQAATNPGGVGGGGYNLVRLTGQGPDVPCALDSGNGTTTHTVVCANSAFNPGGATTPTIAAASIARGYDNPGTVTSASGIGNPLQSAPVTNNGISGSPDIESVAILQNQTNSQTGTQVDVALITFDENIATPTAANLFAAYLTNGNTVPAGLTTGPTASSPRTVALIYPAGTLGTAVGANVQAGAVASTGGPTPGAFNRPDEEGAANTSPTGAAGRTSGPDLLTVTRRAGTDVFGAQTGGFVFRYEFDEAVTTAVNSTMFRVFLQDGTVFTFAAGQCARVSTPLVPGSAGTSPGNAQIDCTFPAGGSNPSNAQMGAAVLATVDNAAVQAQDDATVTGQNNEAGRPVGAAS